MRGESDAKIPWRNNMVVIFKPWKESAHFSTRFQEKQLDIRKLGLAKFLQERNYKLRNVGSEMKKERIGLEIA